jgi:hypothetical protein
VAEKVTLNNAAQLKLHHRSPRVASGCLSRWQAATSRTDFLYHRVANLFRILQRHYQPLIDHMRFQHTSEQKD